MFVNRKTFKFYRPKNVKFKISRLSFPLYKQHLLEVNVSDQRFKLWSSWDGHVQGFGCEKGLEVKQIKVIIIHQVCHKLIGQTIQCGHHGQGELPATVSGAIHEPEQDTKTSLYFRSDQQLK